MTVAVCIDDSRKPNAIPARKWPKKDRAYEVDWVGVSDRNDLIIHLVELKLGAESYPYTGFSHTRFRFNQKGDSQKAEESVKKMLKELGI